MVSRFQKERLADAVRHSKLSRARARARRIEGGHEESGWDSGRGRDFSGLLHHLRLAQISNPFPARDGPATSVVTGLA